MRRSGHHCAPVHDHLAGVARASSGKRGLEVPEPEAVRDRRPDVEPRLEHHGHLVPGFVHFATVDPPDGQHLEHDLVQVEGDLLGRDPEDGHVAAVGHHGERVAQRLRVAGHLEHDVVALAPCRARASRRPGRAPAGRRRSSRPCASRAPAGTGWARTRRRGAPPHDGRLPSPSARSGRRRKRGRPRRGPGTTARCAPRCRTGRRSRPPPRRRPASGARCWSPAAPRTPRRLRRARPRDRCVWAHRWRRPARQ